MKQQLMSRDAPQYQMDEVLWVTHSDKACACWVSPGQGDAANAGLERCPNADTHHGTVYGRPPAVAVETAGYRHDRQVSAAVG